MIFFHLIRSISALSIQQSCAPDVTSPVLFLALSVVHVVPWSLLGGNKIIGFIYCLYLSSNNVFTGF